MAISIKRQWLTTVGGVKVERLTRSESGGTIARSNQKIPLDQPARACLHTTEGHFGSSLEVFERTGTPTWMVGYDELKVVSGKLTNQPATAKTPIRVAQFMPIGEMALTLKNASGGVETNRCCVAQIELVGTCVQGSGGFAPWLPPPPILAVLGDLFRQINEVAGVPLVRGGNGTRSVSRWNTNPGWFGHGEAPENDHTDPRAIRWQEVFAKAKEGQKVTIWRVEFGPPKKRQAINIADKSGSPATWVRAHPGPFQIKGGPVVFRPRD